MEDLVICVLVVLGLALSVAVLEHVVFAFYLEASSVRRGPSEKCPDGARCPAGFTCCPGMAHPYVCCPFTQGVCCIDGQHCCPRGVRCHAEYGRCIY